MRRALGQAFLIVVIGAALGLLANSVSPRRIPWITPPKPKPSPEGMFTAEQAHALWSTGAAFFLDARAPADYEAGHIAQAFNLPVESFAEHFGPLAAMLTPHTPIVVYCDGVECELSQRLADQLRQLGYRDIRLLENGWTVWRKAGWPTEQGKRL
jgi:rhodanese-related sulfurtransferase